MYGKYMLETRVDILFVLRDLIRHNAMATVHFDHGKGLLLTALLAIDDGHDELVLDLGNNPEVNEAATRAQRLTVVTTQGHIKIQFAIGPLRAAEHDGRPAFRTRLPERLLRLQRREYFRLDTPVASPLTCQIPIESPTGLERCSLPLLDLSGGGVGLMVDNPRAAHFPIGAEFSNCRFELPGEGSITAILAIRSSFAVSPSNGNPFTRLGAEFVCLPGSRLNQIQRYITRIERERKARLAGLT